MEYIYIIDPFVRTSGQCNLIHLSVVTDGTDSDFKRMMNKIKVKLNDERLSSAISEY